ncbi:hypothetical protein ABEF92_002996 [Exophiala dermatitidis]
MSSDRDSFWVVAAPSRNWDDIPTINVCGHEVPLPAYWKIVDLLEDGKGKEDVVQSVILHTGRKTVQVVMDVVDSVAENQQLIFRRATISNRLSMPFKKSKLISSSRNLRNQSYRDSQAADGALEAATQREKELLNDALAIAHRKEQMTKRDMSPDDRRKTISAIDHEMKQVLRRHQEVEAEIKKAKRLTALHKRTFEQVTFISWSLIIVPVECWNAYLLDAFHAWLAAVWIQSLQKPFARQRLHPPYKSLLDQTTNMVKEKMYFDDAALFEVEVMHDQRWPRIRTVTGDVLSVCMASRIMYLIKQGHTVDCIPCHFHEEFNREIPKATVKAIFHQKFDITEEPLPNGEILIPTSEPAIGHADYAKGHVLPAGLYYEILNYARLYDATTIRLLVEDRWGFDISEDTIAKAFDDWETELTLRELPRPDDARPQHEGQLLHELELSTTAPAGSEDRQMFDTPPPEYSPGPVTQGETDNTSTDRSLPPVENKAWQSQEQPVAMFSRSNVLDYIFSAYNGVTVCPYGARDPVKVEYPLGLTMIREYMALNAIERKRVLTEADLFPAHVINEQGELDAEGKLMHQFIKSVRDELFHSSCASSRKVMEDFSVHASFFGLALILNHMRLRRGVPEFNPEEPGRLVEVILEELRLSDNVFVRQSLSEHPPGPTINADSLKALLAEIRAKRLATPIINLDIVANPLSDKQVESYERELRNVWALLLSAVQSTTTEGFLVRRSILERHIKKGIRNLKSGLICYYHLSARWWAAVLTNATLAQFGRDTTSHLWMVIPNEDMSEPHPDTYAKVTYDYLLAPTNEAPAAEDDQDGHLP